MRHWKLVLHAFLVIVLLMCFAQPVSAQIPTVFLKPSTITVSPCSEFTIEVWIDIISPDEPVLSYALWIDYTPENLVEEIDVKMENVEFPLTEDANIVTLTLHCLGEGDVEVDVYGTLSVEYGDGTEEVTQGDVDAIIYQRSKPVGGILISNKLTVLAPYLGLVGVVAAITIVAKGFMNRRQKS